MAQITRTVRTLLADQQARNLARQISETVRQLDYLERRDRVTRDFAPRLARLIIEHDGARRKLGDPAARKDSRLPFWENEVKVLGGEIDRKIRYYLGEVADPDFLRLGAVAWAKAVLRRAAAKPKARPAAAKPKRSARPASGTCRTCHKPNQKVNHQGECGVCQANRHTNRPAPAKSWRAPRLKRGGRVVASYKREPDGRVVEQQLEVDEIIDRMTGARRR